MDAPPRRAATPDPPAGRTPAVPSPGRAPRPDAPPRGTRPDAPPRGTRPDDPPRGIRPDDPPRGIRPDDPPRGIRRDDPLRGILLLLAAVTLFSISDAMAKQLGRTLPPMEIAWLRYAAFLPLAALPFLLRPGLGLPRSRSPRLQVLRGLGIAVSALAFIAALQVLPMAEATALVFCSPAFITILSIPLLGEKVGWRRWAAIGVGLAGVAIVARPGSGLFQAAALLPVLAAACWALGAVLTRRMAGDPPETTLFWTAATGFVVMTALLPFATRLPTGWETALGLLTGAVSSGAQWLVVLAYRAAPASLLAPFSYAQLPVAALIGLLAFGAAPDLWTLAGGAVIVASGLYTAHRERVRAAERRAAGG